MTTATEGDPNVLNGEQPNSTPAAPQPSPQDNGNPPPTPATEAIGEPAPNAAPEASEQGDQFAYQETGDPALDTALDFIGRLGIGPDHPAVTDAADGKFERLEAVLEALGDKAAGWQRMVLLAKDAYTRTSTQAQQTQAAVIAAVHEVAGDEKTWNAVKAWAGQNADATEKQAINAMLSAGPVQARAAAMLLTSLYGQASGTVVTPDRATNENAGNGSTKSGALSPTEYASAVRDLRAQLGTRMDDSPEYAALRSRALAWRG